MDDYRGFVEMNKVEACPSHTESAVARQTREKCFGSHVGLQGGRDFIVRDLDGNGICFVGLNV